MPCSTSLWQFSQTSAHRSTSLSPLRSRRASYLLAFVIVLVVALALRLL